MKDTRLFLESIGMPPGDLYSLPTSVLEVAAMNHRDRQMGYNAEQELLSSLGLTM